MFQGSTSILSRKCLSLLTVVGVDEIPLIFTLFQALLTGLFGGLIRVSCHENVCIPKLLIRPRSHLFTVNPQNLIKLSFYPLWTVKQMAGDPSLSLNHRDKIHEKSHNSPVRWINAKVSLWSNNFFPVYARLKVYIYAFNNNFPLN